MSAYLFLLYSMVSVATCFNNNVSPQYNISYFKKDIYPPDRPDHRIPLKMYYPQIAATDSITFPILIFGHCLFGGIDPIPTGYTYIWQTLVPQGYIVAMPYSANVGLEVEFAHDLLYSLNWIMDNCTDVTSCPLASIIGSKAAVSGHSLGGGSSVVAMGNDWSYNHKFDAMITLSACGATETDIYAKQIDKPVMFMDGSHDCMCPVSNFADVYYENVPDKGQCKYETIITNGTHCDFAELSRASEASCIGLETEDCPNKHMDGHISVAEQNAIAVKYISAFVNATLKNENSFDSLNQLVQNDLKKDVVSSSVSKNCN